MALRSIAAEFGYGEHVTTRDCPSVGVVREIAFGHGRFTYRVEWPEFPDDQRFYDERELVAAPKEARRG